MTSSVGLSVAKKNRYATVDSWNIYVLHCVHNCNQPTDIRVIDLILWIGFSEIDDDEEEEVLEEEWVEWIPPDVKATVIVTDVTVDDFTVTLRESERPEGFFTMS